MRTILFFLGGLAIAIAILAAVAGSFGRNPYDRAAATIASPPAEHATAGHDDGHLHAHVAGAAGRRAFNRGLAALKRVVRNPDVSGHELQPLVMSLVDAAHGDASRVGRLLHAWQRHPDGLLGDALGAVLGLLDDPRIAAAAVAEARHARRRERRLAGLDLLDRLDSSDPAVVRSLVGMVTTERDPRLVGKAIFGLGRVSEDPAVRADVIAALEVNVANGDPEVRRRAVIALADWADDGTRLVPVAQALDDPSPMVHTAAAFAIGQSDHVTEEMRDRVAALTAKAGEDWTVRTLARNTTEKLGGHADVVAAFDVEHQAMLAQMPWTGPAAAEH